MQRRIVISLGLLVSIFVLILLLMGCDRDSIKLKTDCIGVIETADNYKYSGISWYDNHLNYVGCKKISIPNMTSTVNKTIKKGDKVYLISNDTGKTSIKSKVVIINMKSNGNYKVYNSSRYINDMVVDKDLYTISSEYLGINVSFIDKIGDKNKKIATLKIDGVVLSKIYAYKGLLYLTGFGYDDQDRVFSKMFVVDSSSMRIVKSMDISSLVVDVTDMYVFDNCLYIGGRTKANCKGEEVENRSLVKMNLDTYEMDDIYIGDIVGQFIEGVQSDEEKYIMFSNYDVVFDKGDSIYRVDLKSNKVKKQQVADIVRDVIVDRKCMYIMGEKYLCKYTWKNDMDFWENNGNLIKKVKLNRIFNNRYSVHTCFIVYFL